MSVINDRFWELILTLAGSGVTVAFISWLSVLAKTRSQQRQDLARYDREIDSLKDKQCEIENSIATLERQLTDIDRGIDVRLTAIEVDIVHIKQLQIGQKEAIGDLSEDIKDILKILVTNKPGHQE